MTNKLLFNFNFTIIIYIPKFIHLFKVCSKKRINVFYKMCKNMKIPAPIRTGKVMLNHDVQLLFVQLVYLIRIVCPTCKAFAFTEGFNFFNVPCFILNFSSISQNVSPF